ncbi:esterase/lipase family protein [Streptomyces coeruleoprunus]|uniref:Esterase/lipase family protein n=1 Tax=Streptomyces coeruleoprunus TaxID=285563 RepID=A0ABV9XLN2_9ACTN
MEVLRKVVPWGLSTALFKATLLEVAILVAHLALYPTGITQERRIGPGPTAEPTRQPGPGTAPGPATAPGAAPAPPSPQPPVVLVHGFIDNRSVFVLLRRALARDGRRHLASLNYSPLTCDLRAAAGLLGRHVEDVCARTGHGEVDIVGHSLGGLIARYYVQRLGGDRRVRTLVTLGTPHSGTAAAPLAGAHPLVRQMRPGSEVLRELDGPAPGCRTRFVSFWSELDRWMVPAETARLTHPDLDAQNVRVSGIGHLALPVHPAVTAYIRDILDTDSPSAATGTSGSVSVA